MYYINKTISGYINYKVKGRRIYKLFNFILVVIVLSILFSLKNSYVYSQWGSDVRLTNDTAVSNTSGNNAWCIAASGDSVHIVWYDYRDGNNEIYYKRSTNGGLNWSADIRLTNNIFNSIIPSVAVFGSVVHVIWQDRRDGNGEIYYKRSTDAGVNWGTDTRLTNDTSISYHPSLTVSVSVVHLVWDDNRNGNYEIYYKRSTDGGTSWGSDIRLTNFVNGSVVPSIAVLGSVVHTVWYDTRDGNWEIYYKRSTDGGLSWGGDIRLTNDLANSINPSVSVSSSAVIVVWYDDRDGNNEIYCKRSTDGGTTWGTDTRLTNNIGNSYNPNIVVLGSIIHIIWYDDRDGNSEIYYKRSTDGGISWGSDTRLTNNPGMSLYPSVAVSGQNVHTVWCDNRDGNYEIYYKRNPTGNQIITNTFYRNNVNKIIGPNQNIYDTINVTAVKLNLTSPITDVNINIDTVISNPDGQLEFTLIHQNVFDTLIYHIGGNGSNFIETILNDSASLSINSGNPPFTGSFKPQSQLSQFNGLDMSGLWILRIYNNGVNLRGGVIKSWSVTVQYNITTEIKKTINEIPNNYSLFQNYPNPFNPSTIIKFQIKDSKFVILKVYDITGKDVTTLVDENLQAGTYEVPFSISQLSSGVYFYKLTTDVYSETKKMIFLK